MTSVAACTPGPRSLRWFTAATVIVPVLLAAALVPATARADGAAPTPEYELPGRSVGVGATSGDGTGGTAPVAEAPDLRPIVYRYVDTLDSLDPLAGLCALAGADPNDGLGAASGWARLVQAFRRDTGAAVGPPEQVCVPLEAADDPEPPETVGSVPTAGDVWRAVALPLPTVYASPPARGIVALGTRVWSAPLRDVEVAVSLDGWTVTGVARPVEYRVDFDEEAVAASAGPGSAQAPIGEWAFEHAGTRTLTVTVIWDAAVTWSGPGVPGIALAAGRASLSTAADYPVDEVRSVLLAP